MLAVNAPALLRLRPACPLSACGVRPLTTPPRCPRCAARPRRSRPLVLRAEAPFERLLAHGVCQFYGMPATSTEMGGSRCVVASWRHGQERARLAAAISVTRTAAECARPLPNTVQEEEEEAGDGERGVGRP